MHSMLFESWGFYGCLALKFCFSLSGNLDKELMCVHCTWNFQCTTWAVTPWSVSCGCSSKLPQTWWLKTTDTYFVPVPEARSLKSGSWAEISPPGDAPPAALEHRLDVASSSLYGCWFLGSWPHPSTHLLRGHIAFSSASLFWGYM